MSMKLNPSTAEVVSFFWTRRGYILDIGLYKEEMKNTMMSNSNPIVNEEVAIEIHTGRAARNRQKNLP